MDESEWVSIAFHGEIPLGGRKCCSVNGRPVVVIRVADQLCAFAFSPNLAAKMLLDRFFRATETSLGRNAGGYL